MMSSNAISKYLRTAQLTIPPTSDSSHYKRRIIQITNKPASVRIAPAKFAEVFCSLVENVYVTIQEDRVVESNLWLNVGCGWIAGLSESQLSATVSAVQSGAISASELPYVNASEEEAQRGWLIELDNRRRIASAISGLLTRCYSLTKARQLAKAMYKFSVHANYRTLTDIRIIPVENLLVMIANHKVPKQAKIFEFVKSCAVLQSNPVVAIHNICEQILDMMILRPTLWVARDLAVLETQNVRTNNDSFVKAAARGDLKLFDEFVDRGQELVALHSDLRYTALHAAADFGQLEIIQRLIDLGMSLDLRDLRLGQTALHFAAMSGRKEIILLLLEQGANRLILNNEGLLPYQLAHLQGHIECREILKQTPPPIETLEVVSTSSSSISLSWQPLAVEESTHAHVDEYMIEWNPTKSPLRHSGAQIIIKETSITIRNLHPGSEYSIMVYSKSVAGWSAPSARLFQKTLPSEPDAPLGVEILRITPNSVLIHWHPPQYTHGGEIDCYYVEVIDDKSIQPQSTVSNSDEATVTEYHRHIKDEKKLSRWHRIIKHSNMIDRYKIITGLNVDETYRVRLRCHNEFGTSPSSDWSPLIVPQPGVIVQDFQSESSSVTLTWFEPVLSSPRKVISYELQLCKLKGPSHKHIILPSSGIDNSESKPENEDSPEIVADTASMDFITMSNELTTNIFVLKDLSPGGKYQCRVRANVSGTWLDWAISCGSDAFSIPARRPDAPTQLTMLHDGDAERENLSTYHDKINIQWVNGIPNGAGIVEYEIQQTKIKNYQIKEITLVRESADDEAEEEETSPDSEFRSRKEQSSLLKNILRLNSDKIVDDLASKSSDTDGQSLVENRNLGLDAWTAVIQVVGKADISTREYGEFLAPCTFQVQNLEPGCSYSFRVRHRNAVGWSDYSMPSAVITTSPTIPPQQPVVIVAGNTYFIVHWDDNLHKSTQFLLSRLDYQVQIASITGIDATTNTIHYLTDIGWRKATSRELVNSQYFDYNEYLREREDHQFSYLDVPDDGNGRDQDRASVGQSVQSFFKNWQQGLPILIDNLIPSTAYVMRVRIRTIAGWSPWSSPSEAYRTLSNM